MIRERAISDLYLPIEVPLNPMLLFINKSKINAPLASTQFGQALFPYSAELNFDFKAIHEILTNWWLELCEISRQQFCEDPPEIAAKRKTNVSRFGKAMLHVNTHVLTFSHVF